MPHEDSVEEEEGEDSFSFRGAENPTTPIDSPSAGQWSSDDAGVSPKTGGGVGSKPPISSPIQAAAAQRHSVSFPPSSQQPVTASRANYSAPSADGKKAPLVLLHITLLFLPGAEETILRKITPTMLERGLLVEHPRGDYQLLEELIIDSLGLDSEPASDSDDENDEWEKSLGVRRVKAKSAWELRVYAANGLMTAGAWKRVWGEMERVDVEVGPRDWRGKEWGRIFEGGADADPSQFVTRGGVRRQEQHHHKKDTKFWMALGALVALLIAAVAGLYQQFAANEVVPVTATVPNKVEILSAREEMEIEVLEATATVADSCAEESASVSDVDVDVDVEVSSSAADTAETPACSSAATVEEAAPEVGEVSDKPEEAKAEQILSPTYGAAEQSAEGWWGWKA
jgi:hypothetical protein